MKLDQINYPEPGQTCPLCNSEIPHNKGYVSWCDCGYNIVLDSNGETETKITRLYEKLGKKRGEKIYRDLAAKQELMVSTTLSTAIAFLLATLVHLFSLSSLLFGFYLLSFQDNNFLIAASLCLLGVAWLARPRVPKLDKNEVIVSRQDFPVLYSAADQLADVMNVGRIDGIVINDEFNASVRQIGWKRKKIMTIGLPLFSLLEKEEQTAILAHEFGHLSNGDLTRSFFIGTALYTLQTWYELLVPVEIDEYENMGLAEVPVYYFMAFLSRIPYSIFFLLVHLLYDGSQKGEYLADYRAAKTVGFQYVISAMNKFQYEATFYAKVRELAVRKTPDNLFEAVEEQIKIIPLREKERLSRIAQLELSKLDATHPPTNYRIQMLEKFRAIPTSPAVSKEVLSNVQKELETQKARVQEEVIDNYRYGLNLY